MIVLDKSVRAFSRHSSFYCDSLFRMIKKRPHSVGNFNENIVYTYTCILYVSILVTFQAVISRTITWTRSWILAAIHHRFSFLLPPRAPFYNHSLVNKFLSFELKNFFSAFNIGHEGDIALTERDGNVYEKSRVRRNAVRQRKKVWPNRVIPYEMEDGLGKKCSVEIG